MMGMPKANATW